MHHDMVPNRQSGAQLNTLLFPVIPSYFDNVSDRASSVCKSPTLACMRTEDQADKHALHQHGWQQQPTSRQGANRPEVELEVTLPAPMEHGCIVVIAADTCRRSHCLAGLCWLYNQANALRAGSYMVLLQVHGRV
jgi:hypothetical protein